MPRLSTLVAASAALTAGLVGTATPADAAAVTCSNTTVVAATGTPYVLGVPHDIADAATATATCTDLQGVAHTATFVFEWYYTTSLHPMPACPTTQNTVVTPTGSSTFVVQGAATCQRPGSSPAATSPRFVTVDLYVDGAFYSTTGYIPVTASTV